MRICTWYLKKGILDKIDGSREQAAGHIPFIIMRRCGFSFNNAAGGSCELELTGREVGEEQTTKYNASTHGFANTA